MDFTIGIFSISGTSAEDLLWDRRPWQTLPHYRGPAIGPMELAHLAVVLEIGDYEASITGFSLLAGESQETPWVIGLPANLAEAIASLDEHDITGAAGMWMQRGDLGDRFSLDELERYLAGAIEFLRDTSGPYVLRVAAIGPHSG